VDTIVDAVGDRTRKVLLLGVTPELVARFDHLEAIDKATDMISALWHPHADTQSVREGNWLELGAHDGPYSAVVGDASLNALQSGAEIAEVLRRVAGRLEDGGVMACRVFERPPTPYTDDDLAKALEDGSHGNFHAFKWMIAMSLAETKGISVGVVDILERFNELFPDRDRVSAQTGWPREVIDTIDVYQQSSAALCFPNRVEFQEYFEQHFETRWLASGHYDLADRCPVVVAAPRN
jgi:hypothetical protein